MTVKGGGKNRRTSLVLDETHRSRGEAGEPSLPDDVSDKADGTDNEHCSDRKSQFSSSN